ncbi:hypothetical protein [Rhodococcus sp. AW25M09]|uniref:hypothetical protein n=1 Tax=Rhodococcus sp. AW25M09 TaxID=1268303 RepID=UPI000347C1D8|nr:hypothetical protein [Rhodococcus sp. AW25M09]
MGNRLRRADQSTRDYLGGPGISLFALVLAFFFVVPGIGKIAGLDEYGIAIAFAAMAVCIIATSRIRRRFRKEH